MKTLLTQFTHHQKIFFLLLTLITGIWILWPYHNFQYTLAQGDHGRDLYCFKKTLQGAIPYRDYWWPYGPLMPYYYSIVYGIFGVSIQSVLLGQNILILGVGLIIYLICSIFLPPLLSFIGPLWYWAFRGTEFIQTYNHIGGLFVLILAAYFLFRYIDRPQKVWVYAGSLSLVLLAFIRINMGIANLFAFFALLLWIDRVKRDLPGTRRKFLYFYIFSATLIFIFLVHWLLLHAMPSYEILQCFPYSLPYRPDFTENFLGITLLLGHTVVASLATTWPRMTFGIILLLATWQTISLFRFHRLPERLRLNIKLVFGSLIFLIVINLHEFLAIGGPHHLSWIQPLTTITIFYLIGIGTKDIKSLIPKTIILAALILIPLSEISAERQLVKLATRPECQLSIGKNRIYTIQSSQWINTVTKSTAFLAYHVPPQEKILAIPFEPLYYFLSDRDSVTRQLIFFEHVNIPPQQEREIISELEENRVNWILISNRCRDPQKGMGTLGETYCPLLAQYIVDHFQVVATYGDWQMTPVWAWNHGVKIRRYPRACPWHF